MKFLCIDNNELHEWYPGIAKSFGLDEEDVKLLEDGGVVEINHIQYTIEDHE